jgi:uncharacterized OsmC-like protein
MSEARRSVSLRQRHDYRMEITWDPAREPLIADEPPPLGAGQGPSPSQLLLAAVANCMTDSLLFALRKFRLDAEPLSASADAEVGRNAEGRLRVLRIDVQLSMGRVPDDPAKLGRALAQFEQFCTVGQSVAQGIPLRVSVAGPDGAVLHASGASA